ncbi:hypothetical protein C1A38_05330 [Verrucosispora sp. ts21]|nr:hypothetical protein C1A38_05330 [Verrucosispora sp. ts21]
MIQVSSQRWARRHPGSTRCTHALGPREQFDLVLEIKAGTLALEPFEPTLVHPSSRGAATVGMFLPT